MSDFLIRLTSVDEINSFIRIATLCPCDVNISSGTQTANAKAYMGVFSLDFAGPLLVTVKGTDAESGIKYYYILVKKKDEYTQSKIAITKSASSAIFL